MNPNHVEGARRLVKSLRKELRTRGEDLKLSVCYDAVAAAAGYRNWTELYQLLDIEGADEWSDERCRKALLDRVPDLDLEVLGQSLEAMRQRFGHWE